MNKKRQPKKNLEAVTPEGKLKILEALIHHEAQISHPDVGDFEWLREKVLEIIKAPTKPHTALIYVEGGVMQGVNSDAKYLQVELFDVDNKEAEGHKGDEIEEEWKKVSKDLPGIW